MKGKSPKYFFCNSLSSFQRVLTPSIIFWTSSTSEYPSLCLLEMSYVKPVCPPDSPRVPRGCSWSSSHLFLSSSTLCLVHPGNVISEASLSTRFSTGATWLQLELFTSLLKFINAVLGPSRKVNMDGCSHTSTKIGWARVDVTVLFIKAEVLARFFL